MKKSIIILAFAVSGSIIGTSCKKSDNPTPAGCASCSATDTYTQKDLLARPSIGIVFNSNPADKDAFNVSMPSTAAATFQSKFQARLLALNPGYTTNILGQTATQFTTLLANDVLNVSTNGVTAFYNGTQLLTGRTLSEDVIDTELTLAFGGPTGTSNSGLTSDHVNGNDKPLLTTFPYLASPF
jgi:hypothetical protein